MFRLFFLIILAGVLSVAEAETYPIRELSLNEAIMLAVRENPNVQTAQLGHVLQKFALEIQQWQFQPHFGLQASHTTTKTYAVTSNGYVTANTSGIQPSVSLLTPIGTQMNLTSTNSVSDHYNPSLS